MIWTICNSIWSALDGFWAKNGLGTRFWSYHFWSICSRNRFFQVLKYKLGYKLNHRTFEDDFWCVKKLKCWILQFWQGGLQGGLIFYRNIKPETKNTSFFDHKMACTLRQPPLEPPYACEKKVMDIFSKFYLKYLGWAARGGSQAQKNDFPQKMSILGNWSAK